MGPSPLSLWVQKELLVTKTNPEFSLRWEGRFETNLRFWLNEIELIPIRIDVNKESFMCSKFILTKIFKK
jgi:hypothetical protein